MATFHYDYEYLLTWKPERERLTRPVYQSLAKALEDDIASGALPAGTKLPPQRELANFLDIHFTTVTRAYKICELKGLIYAVTGSGTFVSASEANEVTLAANLGSAPLIDLGFVSSFESCNELLTATAKKALAQQNFSSLATYDFPTGLPRHKDMGLRWLESLGVHTDANHMAIVSGTQNGLALALLALFSPGDRIAVDTYAYANFIELAKMYRLRLVPIRGDAEGMSPEALEFQCRQNPIRGLFLVPSCNNPTTVTMTDRRKKALARIIRDHGLILIEDDIMAFLTAGLRPDYQGPLYRLVPDQTVYLCGTSKSICSGLRVTYMVFGEPFRENLLKALYNINVKTSSVDAEIISAVIASGKAREIVEKKRLLAKKRQALFDRYFPNGGNCGHPYSFFRWLPIADTRRGAEIEQELLTHGIRVYHSDRFLSGHHEDARYLRIALSTVDTEETLSRGLEILRQYAQV